jgi:hypothetical protein
VPPGRKPPRPAPARTPRPTVPPNAAPATSPYANDYAQAATTARAQLDPIVSALASQIQRQTQAGIGAITGYTNSLAQNLGGEQQKAAGIWGAAQQAQAASEAAFAQRLSSGGTQLAAELGQRLQSINAPEATGQAQSSVAQTGAGAGNASYGAGSAALGQLIAHGASAQDYAGKLPGLAQLGGIQTVRDFGLKQQSLLADKTAELLGQAPALQNQALQYAQNQRSAATSQAVAAAQQHHQARVDALAVAKQRAAELQQRIETTVALGYDPRTGKLTVKAQNDLAKLQLEQRRINNQANAIVAQNRRAASSQANQNARTAAQIEAQNKRAAAAEAGRTARTQAQIKAANERVQNQIDAANKRAAKTGGAAEYPHLSKAQVVHLRSGIANAYYGVPEQKDANGKVVRKALPPVDYQEAIKHAVQAGYSRADATKMANRFFTVPGKRGRPAKPTPDTGYRVADLTP